LRGGDKLAKDSSQANALKNTDLHLGQNRLKNRALHLEDDRCIPAKKLIKLNYFVLGKNRKCVWGGGVFMGTAYKI